ncbi:50S ribosomal protein L25/general stress protein Ctc [Glaciihabitans sp. INWT7]|jgi:large subunit ribosomal protein L25|uniref:50S ribosomal protein L25/general stress protein Ctc n=1 Tax=Microbacteriaceae TaxID=85023 RepID=UPI0016297C65|nr:50S ribosomal protein L25/general stress protein Ctc [Glaciihabitans sp. INWT7]QNE47637.1 50S ribosomal protein L25/general stress protein Ctc [Glaciihabitans sp. INWT7]
MSEKKAHKELTNKISAESRTTFGKGVARKLRAAGKVPAVVYGHGTEPQHVSLPAHEVALLLRKANAILDLQLDGGANQLALVKDVQKDPLRQIIEHIDLIVLRKGERVEVDVAVHVSGEPASGTSVDLDAKSITIEALATNIPQNVVVDVEGLEAGTQIFAKDVALPEGSVLVTDPEVLVVAISIPVEQDLGETPEVEETEEAPAEEAAAE